MLYGPYYFQCLFSNHPALDVRNLALRSPKQFFILPFENAFSLHLHLLFGIYCYLQLQPLVLPLPPQANSRHTPSSPTLSSNYITPQSKVTSAPRTETPSPYQFRAPPTITVLTSLKSIFAISRFATVNGTSAGSNLTPNTSFSASSS